jgi:hypothetical protein
MKEASFVHLDPVQGSFKNRLTNKILTGEEPITSADIARYADELIVKLKQRLSEGQSRLFLINGLSDEALIKRYYHTKLPLWSKLLAKVSADARKKVEQIPELNEAQNPDLAVMKAEIARIREMLMEELRKRLVHDPALHAVNYSDLRIQTSAPFAASEHVKRQRSLNSASELFKKVKDPATISYGESDPETRRERKNQLDALKKLATLPKNPHILLPSLIDLAARETLVEEVALEDQSDDTRATRKIPYTLQEDLQILRDCVDGAAFLADHGLVLQDVSFTNIGSYLKDGKRVGVLFDLEGIYPRGEGLRNRLCHNEFVPPEVDPMESTPVLPSEMVYQLGLAFADIMERWMLNTTLSLKIRENIRDLSIDMTAYDPGTPNPLEWRIDLRTALARMDELIKEAAVT